MTLGMRSEKNAPADSKCIVTLFLYYAELMVGDGALNGKGTAPLDYAGKKSLMHMSSFALGKTKNISQSSTTIWRKSIDR